jgi:hypothetical protein
MVTEISAETLDNFQHSMRLNPKAEVLYQTSVAETYEQETE